LTSAFLFFSQLNHKPKTHLASTGSNRMDDQIFSELVRSKKKAKSTAWMVTLRVTYATLIGD